MYICVLFDVCYDGCCVETVINLTNRAAGEYCMSKRSRLCLNVASTDYNVEYPMCS